MVIVERDVSAAELQRSVVARREWAARAGTSIPEPVRLGAVVLEGDAVLGCAVVEMYRVGGAPQRWCFLAELFVEEAHRHTGLGSLLLRSVERHAAAQGVQSIWTRTAGYEAPGFYARHGYRVFAELEGRYPSGHGEVFLRKPLADSPRPRVKGGLRLEERMPRQDELERVQQGFVEHALEQGNPPSTDDRLGFVMESEGAMKGFVSGLAARRGGRYDPWFTLTDLMVERSSRGHGGGAALLERMFQRLWACGIKQVSTWTPVYRGVGFLHRHGFETVAALQGWAPGSHARVLLRATVA